MQREESDELSPPAWLWKNRLRENDDPTFQTPPSRVNNLSRSLYRQVRDALNNKRLRSDKILEIL